MTGFLRVDVDPTDLVIPADDPALRMTGPLGGTPIASQIESMDSADYEAMVADMLAAVKPWVIGGRLEASTAANIIHAQRD